MLRPTGIRKRNHVTSLAVVLSVIVSACSDSKHGPPYSPEDALKTFRLPEGYRIGLVASEPLVTDPVEIAFDANGLLYVAEMEDYPADAAPGGRIVLLEDKDGNGYYETGNTFADNLPYVNGVMPWRNGVLVTSAPDILYLEDTTGDRRADIRRVVLTGFALTNPQLRMSSLRYGPDNWIYGAYSRSGGQRGYPQFTNHGLPLRFPDDPKKDSADIYPGTDFRFRPDEFKIEGSGGMSQFGLAFDAAGNRFTVWNNIHLRHVVIDGRYPQKNPYLHVSSLMAHISDHGDAAPVYSRAENRLDLHESEIGHFTSACGHSIYTGGLLRDEYNGAAFVCEPVSNLVHADLLSRTGATFSASRAREGEEFLTSTDSWFRPVNTTVGPDGGLYVVDFYRKLVEHPAWIARADEKGIYTHAGVLRESDFLEGSDRGRIYRIVPDNFNDRDVSNPALPMSTTQTLVEALAHPNAWWRTTAQRLLVERQDTSSIPFLKKLLSGKLSPEGKIHALWTLEGLHRLDDDLVLAALRDEHAVVRRQAVLLAEPRLPDKDILERVTGLADDKDPQVQHQVALTLTTLPNDISFPALSRIAAQRFEDPWFQHAVLFSAAENSLQWHETVRAFDLSGENAREGKIKFLQKISSVTGARQDADELSKLLSFIQKDLDPAFQQAGLRGLHEGIRPSAGNTFLSPGGERSLFQLIASPAIDVRTAALDVAEKIHLKRSPYLQVAVKEALGKIPDEKISPEERTHAIRVLGLDPAGIPLGIFDQLHSPQQAEEVQAATAKVLARREDAASMGLLIRRWQSYTAEVRTLVESSFTGSAERLSFLMKALEEGDIQPSWLSRTARSRLAQHPDKNVQQRAGKLFASLREDDRDKVVTAFYESTTLPGDAAKGKELFRKACSTCHRLENVGRTFGPDLLSVTNQTRINLLTMTLHPNENIAPGYDGYRIETTDGRTLIGILGNESSSAVMLRTADGGEEVIARENIKRILPMSQSLMPDGLEAGMSKQDLADLLEYLKGPKGIGDQ